MLTGNVGSLLRFGLPGLMLGAILAWQTGGSQAPQAQAQNYPNNRGANAAPFSGNGHEMSGAANGTIAFCLSDGTNPSATRLLILDVQKKSFAVYRVEPRAERMVIKLEAVRQYKWDLDLAEYNNLPPNVSAVETMVRNPNANVNSDNAISNQNPRSLSNEP